MFKLNDSEKEYRFKTSGPKYLMEGPNMKFAIVRFKPGEDFPAHYHEKMEENFYIMEGEIDIYINGHLNHLVTGDFIHVEPGEVHYCINRGQKPMHMISTLAPYVPVDKVEVPDYPIYD